MFRIILIVLIFTHLLSCLSDNDTSINSGLEYCPYNPPYVNVEEGPCSSSSKGGDKVNINGSAVFEYRDNSNGQISGSTKNIREAEVIIKNSAGEIVKCGSTDASGGFNLEVTRDNSFHKVYIRSRADTNNIVTSVLQGPYKKIPYEIHKSFIPSIDKNIGQIKAKESVYSNNSDAGPLSPAGAFNILDVVYQTNSYIRSNTNSFSGRIDKSVFYWYPGCNPFSYFENNSISSSSFYIPFQNSIYILGGFRGDIHYVDTDHFDDIVVAHEYGHFLESNYMGGSDSPGGRHNADSVIDPRLAWSEGLASFLAGAALNLDSYRDNIGTSDGIFNTLFNLNLKEISVHDVPNPTRPGEGNFRELSVARILRQLIDSYYNNSVVSFLDIWTALISRNGMANGVFKSIGLYHEQLSSIINGGYNSDINNLLNDEEQVANRRDYANVSSGTCGNYPISITSDGASSFSNADMYYDNDFFSHYHPGGTFSLNLIWNNTNVDLDVFVYPRRYQYGDLDGALYSDSNSGTSESISFNLPRGNYMINIFVANMGVDRTTDYELTVNGGKICPRF